jgi:L-threonylcarbamoyladenylate synthase
MIQAHSHFKIRRAIHKIKAGEIIAYPTEAVFGLGCDPLNEKAVTNLLVLKKRPIEKGLILIASSLSQLEPYLILNKKVLARVTPSWPGPITWIIPAQEWVPKWLTGKHSTLAVRVTAHPTARLLCEENGAPLVSTSANITSKPPATKTWMITKNLKGYAVYKVPGEIGQLKQVTPIYNTCDNQKVR